jgi:hypothetical protein
VIIITIEEFIETLKNILKCYGWMIKEEYEWIEGLEKYNIDNDELKLHYNNLMDLIMSANDKIIEVLNKFEGD